jgi:hypothetical protein
MSSQLPQPPKKQNLYPNQYPHQPSQNISPRTSHVPHRGSVSNPRTDLNSNPAPVFPIFMAPPARQPSRVHFDEPSDAEAPGNGMNPPVLPSVPGTAHLFRRSDGNIPGPPKWHIPNYNGNQNDDARRSSANVANGQWPSIPPPQPTARPLTCVY